MAITGANTVSSILEAGTLKLAAAKIKNPKLNAELLLCKALNLSRLELLLGKNTTLALEVRATYDKLLERRIKHEPLQYIEEKVDFFGLDLYINNSVLIPRPETEELISIIKNTVPKNNVKNILDIGTGSGCIALAISIIFPEANVLGIDVSSASIKTANYNKNKLNIQNVYFQCCKIEEFFSDVKFDLIISNPPYISKKDYLRLEPELSFEPKDALTDNGDGLYFYRAISSKFNKLAATQVKLFLECGLGQSTKITSMFSQYNTKILNDFNNIERFIVVST